MKRKKQKRKVDELLEFPKEVYSNEPKLVITGFEELVIENFKGILEYEEFFVRINTHIGIININGYEIIKPEYDNIYSFYLLIKIFNLWKGIKYLL